MQEDNPITEEVKKEYIKNLAEIGQMLNEVYLASRQKDLRITIDIHKGKADVIRTESLLPIENETPEI